MSHFSKISIDWQESKINVNHFSHAYWKGMHVKNSGLQNGLKVHCTLYKQLVLDLPKYHDLGTFQNRKYSEEKRTWIVV